MDLLYRLAASPHQPGDFHEPDDTGRAVQFLLLGNFLISYWPDDAVKELRIVEIESM